ncbi:PEP/pyruvate-binding domain-containing protein [Nucisporomicrobium flavum]|uniref:PEP/pyruvate-binding domain-containing protein n=1 Tax=Nucisporomicrobium flavum TaxID=2785915 RepID=UPI0018F35FDE|nr:PEP/pyruvate-binding domain-containing protein [Nucisporomicrobium flavum]
MSLIVALSEVSTDAGLVGGKAAGLGELIRHGERVPQGFCVTTRAHRSGTPPRAEILAAYERLGGGPVAVRSSATAEDLPDASFAGQQDTVLDVTGPDALLTAIETCWASLHSARAVAYRKGLGRADPAPAMAVIVQRMVDARAAGVLFTANPLTGRRTEMLVDAALGPGTAVVNGAGTADHYVLGGSPPAARGYLTTEDLNELRAIGARVQAQFGVPQDVEWAIDRAGTTWLLQSRPITTLFPAPPDTGEPRVYLEFGHVQGMLQPATPLGMSTLRTLIAGMLAPLGIRADIVDIGGRLYGDLTDLARNPAARGRLVKILAVDFGPRAQAAMEQVLLDPRFAPRRPTERRSGGATPSLRTAGQAVAGISRALARPEAARARVLRAVDRLQQASAPPPDLRSPADRLRFVRADAPATAAGDLTWPIVAGMLAAALPARLLAGVATADEIHTVLAGMPHNVTIEMDLALWHLARGAATHRDLLLDTPPDELAARYLRGDLPEFGLAEFLATYGHRGAAEVDLGVPRWAEDPAPVFAAIANYLRLDDPEQAPDRRFARAGAAAEAALPGLIARARRRRPVRGRLAGFLLRRARALAGLRESGKFAGLYRLQAMREQLLIIGADLAAGCLLAAPGDIVFLTLDEVHTAVHEGADHRDVVTARRRVHERELRRKRVPVALLSDGTDIEAALPGATDADGVFVGVGAAAGRVTGPARIVDDPATARIEPGEILVAATTDPGWTPLFLTAAALVTETGAIMAHGPTVAREYGIPAVICVPGATRRIRAGQVITVDGAAGTVRIDGPCHDAAII